MQVIYERCAGIDVHKKNVVVCVLVAQADGTLQKQIRTFTAMTADLLALDEWLRSLHIEHLAPNLEHSGRGTPHPLGQSAAPQNRPRAENGRKGC